MTDEVIAPVENVASQQQTAPVENASWTSTFKDKELAKHPAVSKFKDSESVFKSYVEAEKRLGGMVSIPKDGDVEGWNKFYSKLGVPESADAYEFEEREFQGIKLGKEQYKDYAKLAKDIGLTQKQVKALADFDFQRQTGAYERIQKQNSEAEQARKAEIEKSYADKYELAQKNVNNLLDKFADSEIRDKLGSVVGKDPSMFRFFATMAEQFSEDTLPQPKTEEKSVEDARTEYNAMLMDKKHPLHDSSHPDYEKAQEKHMKLFRKINNL